jgi:hypothetical protein
MARAVLSALERLRAYRAALLPVALRARATRPSVSGAEAEGGGWGVGRVGVEGVGLSGGCEGVRWGVSRGVLKCECLRVWCGVCFGVCWATVGLWVGWWCVVMLVVACGLVCGALALWLWCVVPVPIINNPPAINYILYTDY